MRISRSTEIGRSIVSWLYLISGLISVVLLVYLLVALLKPEIFE
jgi:K+-transporting ATPase KdpF subunit